MKLSIIVPVYNVENYVSATLDSLLSIRFSWDYEIIVVNDGSTDGTEDVVRGCQQKSDRIRLFSIENQGVSNARNYGLRQAAGDYITFMDGDDTVEPDFYERAVRELDSGGYDFVQGNYLLIDSNGSHQQQYVEADEVITDRAVMLQKFFGPEKAVHNSVWGKVYRAETARRAAFDTTLAVSEDQKYVFDLLCAADRIKLLSAYGCNYLQREASAVHTIHADRFYDRLAVLDHCKKQTPYPDVIADIECQRIGALVGLYYQLCVEKDPRNREIRKELLKSPYQQLWPMLDKRTQRRILLSKFAGSVYGLYLSCR